MATTTINADIVVTNKGREMIARFLANYDSWVPDGYQLWANSKWGEGGWEEVNGTKEPKDASNFKSNSDLEIVLNPGDYTGASYASALIPIEQTNELVYESGGSDILRVRSVLETSEENDEDSSSSGNQNPTFWEVGVFDNASVLTSYNEDHMILYGILESGTDKTQNRAFEVNHRIPY
jgi:hypothetical protein